LNHYNNIFELLNPLIDIVNQASQSIMEVYDRNDFDIMSKYDDSPLTSADLLSNDIICKGIKSISDFPIISEENMEIPYDERIKYEYFWLIDPIDGTKEFIKKNDEFTINVALVHKDQAILGIVKAPAIGETYYAVKGFGAYLETSIEKTQLFCTEHDTKADGLRIPVSMSHINNSTLGFLSQFSNHIRIPSGAALKFMLIANGKADIYPRLAPTMEWDTAAPQIIVEEAGGTLINFDTGLSMRYNKQSLINPGFITYSKILN
jgi:3'(2'), 5'-bisphosphate nucleotidase